MRVYVKPILFKNIDPFKHFNIHFIHFRMTWRFYPNAGSYTVDQRGAWLSEKTQSGGITSLISWVYWLSLKKARWTVFILGWESCRCVNVILLIKSLSSGAIRLEPIYDFCDVWLTGGSNHPQDRTSVCRWKLPQYYWYPLTPGESEEMKVNYLSQG